MAITVGFLRSRITVCIAEYRKLSVDSKYKRGLVIPGGLEFAGQISGPCQVVFRPEKELIQCVE
jgi:hypothetical protein